MWVFVDVHAAVKSKRRLFQPNFSSQCVTWFLYEAHSNSSFRTCLYAWYFIHWVWSWRIFIRSNLSCRWRAMSLSRSENVCVCVYFRKRNRIVLIRSLFEMVQPSLWYSVHSIQIDTQRTCMHWHDEDLSIYAIVARYLSHKRHYNLFLDSNNPICFMRQILSIEYASNYELPACIYSVNSISWLAIDWFELMWKKTTLNPFQFKYLFRLKKHFWCIFFTVLFFSHLNWVLSRFYV